VTTTESTQAILVGTDRVAELLELSPDIFCVLDGHGTIHFINESCQRVAGYSPEEIVGRSIFDFVHTQDRAAAEDALDRLQDGRGTISFECRCVCKDETICWLSCTCTAPQCPDGLALAVCREVKSRKAARQIQSQRELDQLKGRLEPILDSISDGICGLDAHGRVTFVNPAAEKMLGWTAAELVGKHEHDTFHHTKPGGAQHKLEECPVHAAIRTGDSRVIIEDVFWHRSEGGFPVEYTATPIRDRNAVVGAVITFRDLTKRHRRLVAEQELRAARRVQQLLYPAEPPQVPGFDIAGAAFPADMACGDYFDFLPLSDGNLAIAVGDVSGHGLGPALHMVQARAYLRSTIAPDVDEVSVLRRLNELLIQNKSDDFFLTLFYGNLDPSSRVLNYAGAGHEARLLRADSSVEALPSTGIALGVLDELAIRPAAPTQLGSGDVLVIATDGLTETYSPDREIFGWTRALQVVDSVRGRSAASIIESLKTETREFADNQPQLDDVTIVIAKAL
jgi:sigma-B regulation protein RsbU (phosphoserine phosphatase)